MRSGAGAEETEAAEAAAKAAQARYERLKAGSRVEDIRQAEGELKREEATRARARKELRRAQGGFSRNASTAFEFDSAGTEEVMP
jgi:hypothetical protein